MSWPKFAFSLIFPAVCFAAETIPGAPGGMIVHEWGTFTSVAGPDGASVPWTVLVDNSDLPCFVVRSQVYTKATAHASVRMETPVLYFYTPSPATVSVKVDFPEGGITEWFPPAALSGAKRLAWERVEALPGNKAAFPGEPSPSHYYAARATDAAPVRVGDRVERFLFYRGIGEFQVPLLPKFAADGAVALNRPLPAILFENRGGRVGFRVASGTRIAPPELTGSLDDLREKLAAMLTEAGLYPKEARAMIETWRDSWFEEGMRLLYLVPRERVDQLLPLEIEPRPQAIERVFVGRIELLSPAMRETIGTALAERDELTLRRYGRFLNAFAAQIVGPADAWAGQYLTRLTPSAGSGCGW